MVLYAFLLHHVPEVVRAAIVSLLPLAEFFILWRKRLTVVRARGSCPYSIRCLLIARNFLLPSACPVAFLIGARLLRQTSVQLVIRHHA